jgi:hypothetical protein
VIGGGRIASDNDRQRPCSQLRQARVEAKESITSRIRTRQSGILGCKGVLSTATPTWV